MSDSLHLLPERNSSPFEQAFSLAIDTYSLTDQNVTAMRGLKLRNPPPSFLPYLVYEYGLGELTPYLPNLYDLIAEGIDWQRVRGTPAAMELALGWLTYSGAIEEPSVRRMRWNLFQLALDRVRDNEADLARIEGVARLSAPLRSYFWRGFSGYDVRALEYGWNRWGQNIYGAYSGARLLGGQAKWSYGRRYAFDYTLNDDDLNDLGVYLPPAGSAPLGWGAFPWIGSPWTDSAARARSVAMLEAAAVGPAWVVFKDADGDVIGYRRARAARPVEPSASGPYRINSARYAYREAGATILLIEAMTDFGDGFGSTAASTAFILQGEPGTGHPAGSLWLPPGALVTTSPELAPQAVNIEFGRTVRERVSAVFRF